jgi:hypothetical protein
MTVIKTETETIEALLRKTINNKTRRHINGAYTPTPPITNATAVIHCTHRHGDRLNIIHEELHVTTHNITITDDEIQFNSTIRITSERPDSITPTDTVIHYDGVTHIQHGPGHETRIINTSK